MSSLQDKRRSTVKIRFHASQAMVTFRRIPYEGEDIYGKSFASMPAGKMVACEPQLGFTRKCTFEEYHGWQKDFNKNSQSAITIYARNYPDVNSTNRSPAPEERFFLKVVPHVEDTLAGKDLKDKLHAEALFYWYHLASVQGEAVPRHYGVWEGQTEWGSRTALSIMQWGGSPYFGNIKGSDKDRKEVKVAVLKAFEALHMKAKVAHDNFLRTPRDILHILYDEQLEQAFIVDFSRAILDHQCELRMSLFEEYASMPPDTMFGCEELLAISHRVGMTKSGPYTEDPAMVKRVKEFDERYNRAKSASEKEGDTDTDDPMQHEVVAAGGKGETLKE